MKSLPFVFKETCFLLVVGLLTCLAFGTLCYGTGDEIAVPEDAVPEAASEDSPSMFYTGEAIQAETVAEVDRLRVVFPGEPSVLYAPFYMAKECGYYDQAGLPAVEFSHIMEALNPLDSLLTGRADFLVSSFAEGYLRCCEGAPVAALSLWGQGSSSGFLVRHDFNEAICQVGDLQGKRIGVPYTEEGLTRILLASRGMSADCISIEPRSTALLDAHSLDAVFTRTFTLKSDVQFTAFRRQYRFLPFSDEGFRLPEDALFCRTPFRDKFPDLCRRFLEATLKGYEYAKQHRDETVQVVAFQRRRSGHSEDVFLQGVHFDEWLKFMDPEGSLFANGRCSEADFNSVVKLLLESGLTTSDHVVPFNVFFRYPLDPEKKIPEKKISETKISETNDSGPGE